MRQSSKQILAFHSSIGPNGQVCVLLRRQKDLPHHWFFGTVVPRNNDHQAPIRIHVSTSSTVIDLTHPDVQVKHLLSAPDFDQLPSVVEASGIESISYPFQTMIAETGITLSMNFHAHVDVERAPIWMKSQLQDLMRFIQHSCCRAVDFYQHPEAFRRWCYKILSLDVLRDLSENQSPSTVERIVLKSISSLSSYVEHSSPAENSRNSIRNSSNRTFSLAGSESGNNIISLLKQMPESLAPNKDEIQVINSLLIHGGSLKTYPRGEIQDVFFLMKALQLYCKRLRQCNKHHNRRTRQRSRQRKLRTEPEPHREPQHLRDSPFSRNLTKSCGTRQMVRSWLTSLLLPSTESLYPITPVPPESICCHGGRAKKLMKGRCPPSTLRFLRHPRTCCPSALGGRLSEGPVAISADPSGPKSERLMAMESSAMSDDGPVVPVPVDEARTISSGPQPSLCVRVLSWQMIPLMHFSVQTSFLGKLPELRLLAVWKATLRHSRGFGKEAATLIFGVCSSLLGFMNPGHAVKSTTLSDQLPPSSPKQLTLNASPQRSLASENPSPIPQEQVKKTDISSKFGASDTSHSTDLELRADDARTMMIYDLRSHIQKPRKNNHSTPSLNPVFPWHRKQRMAYDGEPDIAIHNGYDPGGGFHIGGVHPVTQQNNDLVMYKTTDNILDLKKLSEDSPTLKETLLPLLDAKVFEETMFLPSCSKCKGKRRISRGMLKHLPTLLECDHAELAPDGLEILDYLGCFLVPKKDGTGRFICNCRPTNANQVPPGPMGLPSIQSAIRQILTWSYASQCDGKSFFCQFLLAEDIRKHFACRLADMRGKIVTILLKRMPMGWSHAPRIAQAVANHIMEDIGFGWVDNFVFGATTVKEFEEKRELLRSRLKRYNLEVDDLTMEMTQSLFCLGLEFDLKIQKYRLDPKWIEKRASVFAYGGQLRDLTFRQFFELTGSLIWASYVTDDPLWMHAEALAALSQLAKVVQDRWDDKCEVPEYAFRDIQSWIDQVTQNCWCGSPHVERHGSDLKCDDKVNKDRWIFSDASDSGAAWIRIVEKSIVAGQQWHRDPSVDGNIFMGELDALLQGWQANTEEDKYAVDNLGLRLACKKGHSSSYEANVKLREFFGRRWPKVAWVSTLVNVADPFSRGISLPPFDVPARLKNWVVYDDGSGDNLSESSKILSDFPNFPEWKKLKPF